MPKQRPASLSASRSRLPWRGVALGAIIGTLLCALTPWNDLVLGNTSLIGSFLPLGLIGLLALAIGVNAVSAKWRARTIFSRADLSAALALGLIACTLPASGLMRYLPAGLIGLQYQTGTAPDRAKLLSTLALPPSLLPSDDAAAPIGGSDRTVNDYYNRASEGSGDSMIGRVPWSKWVRPAFAWGVLLASIYVAVLSLSAIVHRQWAVNERISFPLATVYGLLIEAPQPGRALNGLLSSRAFWIAAALVFAIHLLNGAHQIRPSVPQIPLNFDFNAMFTTPPWDRIDPFAKRGVVLFSVIGICYFVRSDVALSLWVCYLMLQIYRMLDPSRALELGHPAATDQAFGALLAYAATVVWIGRRHYRMVFRAMLGRAGTSDVAQDDVTPYGAAGWFLLIAVATASVWLVWAGTGVIGALCIVLTALTVLMVVARVVAETGLFFVQVNAPIQQPMLLLAATDLIPLGGVRVRGPDARRDRRRRVLDACRRRRRARGMALPDVRGPAVAHASGPSARSSCGR